MIQFFLKFVISFGLIFYLIKSDKLQLKIFQQLLDQPQFLIWAIMLNIGNLIIVAFRWKILLQDHIKAKLPSSQIISYSFIGLFFNAVLPGSVSGDLLKIFYTQNLHPKLTKKFLLASVLIDRVAGLMGLILLLGIFSIFNYQDLINLHPMMSGILKFNLTLLAGVIIFLFVFSFAPQLILKSVAIIPILKKSIKEKISTYLETIIALKKTLFRILGLSIIIQFVSVLVFYVLTNPFSFHPYSLQHAFSLIPLGYIGIAIPIAPSGLGVGHAVFDKIFSFIGISNGADLFNLYFIVTLLCNLIGIIPYLKYSKRNKKK